MKTLIAGLILTLGVTSVTSVADVQAMGAKSSTSTGRSQANQFSSRDRRANSNRQQSARHVARPQPAAPPAPERPKAPAVAPKVPTPEVNAGWIKCPCGEDCKCPSEEVCKKDECKKNYLVMFTAKWCTACPRMKKVLDELGADGYIVYFVDIDENKDKAQLFKVTTLPTVVVMDNGKEVRRLVGISSAEAVKEGVKKRSQQGTTDYNFLD